MGQTTNLNWLAGFQPSNRMTLFEASHVPLVPVAGKVPFFCEFHDGEFQGPRATPPKS